MADRDSPWQRDGLNIEELPDPFANADEDATELIRWVKVQKG